MSSFENTLNYFNNRIRWFYRALKSQISSTKSQINLKYQYTMTKTSPTAVLYCCTQLCQPMIMQFGNIADGSKVLNL